MQRHLNTDYLDLLGKTLLFSFWKEPLINEAGVDRPNEFVTDEQRANGRASWPAYAFTMIGSERLGNIRTLCQAAVEAGVPGAFVECGVWRGGACIYARACLPEDRVVMVCDTFDGIPLDPAETYWQDYKFIKVPQSTVEASFRLFGLLNNVRFVSGKFSDSLHTIIDPIAVLRVDGDMRSSTFDTLTHLYPLVSPGGFIILDDFHTVPQSRQAVEEYFKGQLPAINEIDGWGVWFKK